MINYRVGETEGASTEGFNAHLREDGVLVINGGKIRIYDDVYEFAPFGFRLESDDEFPVYYCVLLCGDETVVVERFVMLPDIYPSTSTKKELLRIICEVNMQPNTTAEEADIIILLLNDKNEVGGGNNGESSGDGRSGE